ncbi:ROK family transcriptional regulator [Streptomyces sp. NPDC047072]|uniref:ROK family transcriptional regulator n=1 Tax=Streptomyces sp. NPDC047072 TaxID=3154809 RepID=UPI0033EE1D76
MGSVNRTNGGANVLALRSHNTALVLDLLRGAGPEGVSRLELADRTGLTPQAVSKITARLKDQGLATEAGHRASTGGKPRTVLRLVPAAGHAVGVHLDRDGLRALLVDLTGGVLAERRASVDLGAGSEEVLRAVTGEVERLVGETLEGATSSRALSDTASLLGVGIALPGPLDHHHGILHRVTGFPEWNGFPLRTALEERLGVPVAVDKDTNAAALALAVAGRGSDTTSFAYLHLGTGLGAGLVLDGNVHRGARTAAGEFGHQVIHLDGPPCTCGNHGCIETLCLAAVADGSVEEAARVLGVGAANLVGLLDIDEVLLGGRTVLSWPEVFAGGVSTVLRERAGEVPVTVVSDGIAEGAAQLLLGPVFGRRDA